MQVDVYPTDAEAFEAAAALVATHLRASGARPTIALAGGRGGRGVLVALAVRSDVPWDRVAWFWGDERCVPADDPRSNVRVARDSRGRPAGPAGHRHRDGRGEGEGGGAGARRSARPRSRAGAARAPGRARRLGDGPGGGGGAAARRPSGARSVAPVPEEVDRAVA